MSDVTRYVAMMQNTLSAKGYCIRRKNLRKIAGRAIKGASTDKDRILMMVEELRKICLYTDQSA